MAGLTDFNDLHVVQGTDAVRAQLELVASSPAANHPVVDIPPDDFYDHYEPSRALPEDSGGFGKWNLIDLVRHVSLIYGTDTVWDAREKIQMRRSYLSHIIGRELFKEWDNHPSRRVVKGLVFEPSGIVPDNHVNLFDGFPISPGAQGARGCAKILNHIYRLCGCREDEFNFLIRWMAYPLQNPGAKMATSVIMHGAEGTGKSLIWDRVIGAIYGKYAITVGQMQIESQFTGWQSCKCFAQCEEVVARNEQAHYKGRLKHLVSGATLIINEKQLPAREENNHLNTVFLSNSDKPLSLDLGDRRYLVLKIMDVPNQAYFDELLTEIDSGGVAEFYGHLLSLDMAGFNGHTKPPLNDEKRHLIGLDLPNTQLFFNDWQDGLTGLPFGCAPKGVLYSAYRRWCEERNEFKVRDRDVSSTLRRYLAEDRVDMRLPDDFKDRKTVRCWVPIGLRNELGQESFARRVEVECQQFVKAFDDLRGENASF